MHADGAGLLVHDVHAVNGVHVFQDSGGHHFLGTSGRGLLGVLEDELHAAVESVLELGQCLGGTEQHGGVGVVTARVHHTVNGGLEVVVGLLVEGKRVHIGAQRHGLTGALALDHGHHGSFGGVGRGQSEALQGFGHELGRVVLLEGQLGVSVKVAAPLDDVGGGNVDLDSHGRS